MLIKVSFYSYFKELTGCAQTTEEMPDGSSLESLLDRLAGRFPKWAGLRKSALLAVGVDYQDRSYVLRPDDEVSLFPPVQGG